MTKEQVFAQVKIEGESSIVMNGVEISAEDIAETFKNKVWKSANVLKNRREADGISSVKAIIGKALTLKLVEPSQALTILLTGNKAEAKKLADQFPKTEKSDEPSAEDVAEAIELVANGGGQSVSL